LTAVALIFIIGILIPFACAPDSIEPEPKRQFMLNRRSEDSSIKPTIERALLE
jgi:energy-converting hydrogenase Eha subunit F